MFLFVIIFYSCSFDNKSGIWKNESLTSKDDNDIFREFKKLAITYSPFKKIVKTPNNFEFKVPVLVNATEWNDIFFSDTNNLINLKYSNLNKQNFRSKKISRKSIGNYILSENNKLFNNSVFLIYFDYTLFFQQDFLY